VYVFFQFFHYIIIDCEQDFFTDKPIAKISFLKVVYTSFTCCLSTNPSSTYIS